MNPELWPFRVGVRLYKAQSCRRDQDGPPGQSGSVQQITSGGERDARNSSQQSSQFQNARHYPPGSEEYSRNKRRHQYRSDGEWQVPRNTVRISVNEQSLLEALTSLLRNTP